jgi:Undecaprenyl-phosphate glucose phosphotransferase
MYKLSRYRSSVHTLPRVLKANFVYFGIAAVVIALITEDSVKRFLLVWILLTAVISTALITFKCHLIKNILAAFRRRQYNLRRIIIVGDNTAAAEEYIKQVTENNSDYGAMVLGYVGDKINESVGIEKLGAFNQLSDILDKYKPTDVVFAIDSYDKRRLIKLVNMCDDRCIKVYFLPVIYGFFKNPRQIEQVGNIPLINVHSTPLDNRANAAMKRLVDIIGASILILLTSPLMIFAAIGVKITSPGPILFKQIRVGKMGKRFKMLKFRSMRIDNNSTKEWTTGTDPRKTRFGTFIRKTAIDELPQLFNVLFGTMSLVGPRPELPNFVEEFKEIIPLYMVKHYVKPGMTGLAQIKGLRGDTSVEDRIHEDIEYIENWTFWMDIYILLKTPMKAVNKNEKYVEAPVEGDLLDDETTRDFAA